MNHKKYRLYLFIRPADMKRGYYLERFVAQLPDSGPKYNYVASGIDNDDDWNSHVGKLAPRDIEFIGSFKQGTAPPSAEQLGREHVACPDYRNAVGLPLLGFQKFADMGFMDFPPDAWPHIASTLEFAARTGSINSLLTSLGRMLSPWNVHKAPRVVMFYPDGDYSFFWLEWSFDAWSAWKSGGPRPRPGYHGGLICHDNRRHGGDVTWSVHT